MPEVIQIDRVYGARELAEVVGVTHHRICVMCKRGTLKAKKDMNGHWRIPGISWANWLISHMPCRGVPERWMTPAQAARYCDVTDYTIRRWCNEGIVPLLKDGRPGYRKLAGRTYLVHGEALRRVVTYRGPKRERKEAG